MATKTQKIAATGILIMAAAFPTARSVVNYETKLRMYDALNRTGLYTEFQEDNSVYVWKDITQAMPRIEGTGSQTFNSVGAVASKEFPKIGAIYIRREKNEKAENVAKQQGLEIEDEIPYTIRQQ